MKTVLIPSDVTPFCEAKINGKTYRYPSGTAQNVPDEVASLIENINALTPVPGLPGKPGQVWMLGADGYGHWTDLPAPEIDTENITPGKEGQYLATRKVDGVLTTVWHTSRASIGIRGVTFQAAAVADATDDTDIVAQFNALLAAMRAAGMLYAETND